MSQQRIPFMMPTVWTIGPRLEVPHLETYAKLFLDRCMNCIKYHVKVNPLLCMHVFCCSGSGRMLQMGLLFCAHTCLCRHCVHRHASDINHTIEGVIQGETRILTASMDLVNSHMHPSAATQCSYMHRQEEECLCT